MPNFQFAFREEPATVGQVFVYSDVKKEKKNGRALENRKYC